MYGLSNPVISAIRDLAGAALETAQLFSIFNPTLLLYDPDSSSGRPRNDKVAPDVRAPVVRGRYAFWASSTLAGRLVPPSQNEANTQTLIQTISWNQLVPRIYRAS